MKTKPLNLIMGLFALMGAILIIIGENEYGVILLLMTILVGTTANLKK